MERNDIDLAKRWLEHTYLKGAEILECEVLRKRYGIIMQGKLKVSFAGYIIVMHIWSDIIGESNRYTNEKDRMGYRGETYLLVDNKKEFIDGYGLRVISERGL